ncbi:MAG: leucine-rich repeat protein [Candidatus Methanomethylophilaceae archaeon]|nr:leucine-rich repeat protein [Candidatus Methanomethylophilaceae archaeon]
MSTPLVRDARGTAKGLALAVLLLAVSALALSALPGDSDASVIGGNCGTGVAWSFDTDTGVMTVTGASGSSVMDNYESADDPAIPWKDLRNDIRKVVFTGTFRNSYVGWTNDIGSYAFAGCPNLAEVDLTAARGLDVIGEHAFDGCSSLRKVSMSDYVEYIKAGAFAGCPLEDVRVSGNSTLIYNWDGMSPYDVADMLGSEVIFDGTGGYIVVDSRDFVVSFASDPEDGGEHIRPVVIRKSGNTGTTVTVDVEKSTITLTRVKTGSGNQTETRTINVVPADGYAFAGCSPTGRISSAATITVSFSGSSHAVTWMSQDGSEVLETDTVAHGARPSYDSDEPSKEPTAQYAYEFAGWAASPGQTEGSAVADLPDVTADATYFAAFSESVREYQVTVNSNDCGITQTVEFDAPYGTQITVSDDGKTLTVVGFAEFTVSLHEDTAEYRYAFSGWMSGDGELAADTIVAGDFEAHYEITRTVREYAVAIVSSDEEAGHVTLGEITAPYGATVVLSGNVLTIGGASAEAIASDSTDEFSYSFEGWTVPSRTVIGEMTATAEFSSTLLSFVYEGVKYRVLADRTTVSAVGFDGEPAQIEIPGLVYCGGAGFVPVSIADGAFAACSTVASVKVGDTVARIGAGALDSPYLVNIEVSGGNEVYSSVNGVLYDRDAAVLLKFPAAKQTVAFSECVAEIAAGAFQNVGAALKGDCEDGDAITYFRYAKIPATVSKIGDGAFSGSTLECLKFSGGTVSRIGDRAFACDSLNYIVFNADFGCVAENAFDGCVFIGESGEEMALADAMAGHKFTGKDSDLDLYVPPLKGTIVSGDVKYRITSNGIGSKNVSAVCLANDEATDLYIPASISYLGFDWTVTSIAPKAFLRNSSIVSVTSDVDVGSSAFHGCENLECVTLDGAASVGAYAFFGCKALEGVDLGGVTVLGTSAFSGCDSLSTIDLSGVASIGKHAFYCCKNLAFVDLSGAVAIGYGAFSGTGLQEVEFGDGLADVDSKAFFGYTFKSAGGTKIKATAENLRGCAFSGQGKILVAEA